MINYAAETGHIIHRRAVSLVGAIFYNLAFLLNHVVFPESFSDFPSLSAPHKLWLVYKMCLLACLRRLLNLLISEIPHAQSMISPWMGDSQESQLHLALSGNEMGTNCQFTLKITSAIVD